MVQQERAPEKNSRKRGQTRAEKTRQTRMRMLDAARELFLERGYGSTTLQDIAKLAGVAVQTIYFTFGNKRTLLKELVDVSIAGDAEDVATMDRPWFQRVLESESAAEQLRLHVHATRDILGRVAPVLEVVRSATASDPEVADLWDSDVDPRLVVLTRAAKALCSKPGIRVGLKPAYVADVLYGLLSPELFLVFVRDRGWSPAKWETWTHGTLRDQLCERECP